MKNTNTHILENFIAAITPGGIEAQEKAGQIQQSLLETLPKQMQSCTKNDFERLGFVFKGEFDDLFWECEFPKGWRKQATAHSMWSKLLDEKGRNRGAIFYKAAFYDRDAFVSLNCRYSIRECFMNAAKQAVFDRATGEYADGVIDRENVFTCWEVLDGARVLFSSQHLARPTDNTSREQRIAIWDKRDELRTGAEVWLDENYPEWKSLLAYWDKD